MKRFFPVASLFILVVVACEKAELPKPLSGLSSTNTVQVNMGSDYSNQLFLELATASIVSQNNREIWDLGFENGINGRHIILNSSKFMAMSKTNSEDLATVSSQTAVTWLYDNQSGKKDSSSFYNWELNKVYIIDKGISVTGQQLGKIKMQIIAFTETSYTIRWGATLNATLIETTTINKSTMYNFTFFSFLSGETVVIEPEKDSWDLCFTSYTNNFSDGTPYLVTGVLSNRNLTRVAESLLPFEAVDFTYASTLNYSTDIDIIGYDWKTFDFDQSLYIIQFDKVYIIQSVQGLYYKLRFLDFYDDLGTKGAPTFELYAIIP